jgi:sterol O-acyltransferase
MKSYSFIRENAYKVLWPWKEDDSEGPPLWYQGQIKPQIGSMKQYLYFLFSPTFLYRDSYPR